MKTPEAPAEIIREKISSHTLFLIISSVVFGIVCSISIFFFFKNMSISHVIEANKNEIIGYTSSIEKLKNDANTIRAELVSNNMAALIQNIQRNKAQIYINEVRDIASKAGMMFSGFSYSNGKINTSAVAIPEKVLAGEDGIKKISNFIYDYRTKKNLMFQLSPILSVSGYEQKRAFSIEFSLAPVLPTGTPK